MFVRLWEGRCLQTTPITRLAPELSKAGAAFLIEPIAFVSFILESFAIPRLYRAFAHPIASVHYLEDGESLIQRIAPR